MARAVSSLREPAAVKESVHSEEIVIVGGGLAGASAACILAQAGRPALLIERETAPRHKVCGEFLSIEAQTYLAHLGISLDDLGASRIASVRLIHGLAMAEADLPFTARGLSRRTLDEVLLERAVSSGAGIVRGPVVRTVSADESGIRADAGEFGEIHARTLFLATGKHDVRGAKRPPAGTAEDLIGFKAHYVLDERQQRSLEGAVEIFLFPGGYAGLQMIERGVANLCLVVTRHCFETIGRSWCGLLDHVGRETPLLENRLHDSVPVFERPLSIFQIPYGFVHSSSPTEPQGLFRLGDQAGVIPSFTGDGMAIALHSGCLAASTYLSAGQASSHFHRRLRADISHQIQLASLFHKVSRQAAGRQAILGLCRAWPALMSHVTALTRIRSSAVQRSLAAS
jgi:flavin-dependent dehydrogenase